MSTESSVTLPRLIDAVEVSRQLGIPQQQIYSLVRQNRIPHVRAGRRIRFSVPALLDWIEKGGSEPDHG